MPFARCREYDDEGNTKNGGCPKIGICQFIHPSDPAWSQAPRRRQFSSERGRGRERGRGHGRGRGGPPTGPRHKTGSNNISRGGGVSSNTGGDTGWGSTSGSWSGTWGGEVDKAEGSSTSNQGWSTGWGDRDDIMKDDGGDKGKGKGKATEFSWGGGGWGQMEIDAENSGSSSWGNLTWPVADTTVASNDGGWGASSPKATEAVASSWNVPEPPDESVSTKNSTAPPSLGMRRTSDSSVLKAKAKDPIIESLTIPPTEPSAAMDVDSPQTSIPPLSATTSATAKPFGSPVVNTGLISSLKRQISPGMSMQTSRSTSVDVVVPSSKEPRTLKSVSHKEAKVIWNEYIELIYRAIMLRLRWNEERVRHQDYKAAQNSSIYVKVGSRGTTLLDESIQTLKGRAERRDKEYKDALNRLCAFEEGFDFPMQLLTSRRAEEKKIKEELIGLREYVKNVKICVDTMRLAAEDIDNRARAGPELAATPTPIATGGPERIQSVVTSIRETQLDKRLARLEDKATDFSNLFMDIRSALNVNDVVQEKLESMKSTFQDCMEMGDDDNDELSEKITKLSEGQASLGQDLVEMYNNVAEIFTSFKQMEVAAEQEIDRFKKSLEEDRGILAAGEAHTRNCQDLLDRSAENLESLREEVRVLQDLKAPAPSTGISEELLDQLVAKVLPAIRVELDPKIDVAIENLTSSVAEVIQEHNKKQVQALSATLIPVYKMSSELQAKIEFKSQRVATCSRPASPHIGEARTGAQVQTSHS